DFYADDAVEISGEGLGRHLVGRDVLGRALRGRARRVFDTIENLHVLDVRYQLLVGRKGTAQHATVAVIFEQRAVAVGTDPYIEHGDVHRVHLGADRKEQAWCEAAAEISRP